ncbi:hypothetical protein SAY87_014212 [Trapa incisa]|uniref:Protein kinase domain-containing protein n=1 Tax=Trapa incisa TaxID=236973 RepID=A0AAN7GJL6_9MYRT|nr:hypothetical protein SAY87_014212 [Trapa incisa]
MGFPRDSSPTSHCPDSAGLQIKTIIGKMVWDFGLSCFFSPADKRSRDQMTEEGNQTNMENNRAWLLAESADGSDGDGGGAALNNADPQSVHSSFRFSLIELDSLGIRFSDAAAATVLMVNLESGLDESHAQELQWRTIQSVEKNISPLARTLVRFSYAEILSATCNFSQGRVLGRGALGCVYRGRAGFMWTAVAIKQLDKDNNESPKSFCRELMIASSLHNPNIAPLLGYCIDLEGGLFLVYKYVSGGSLEGHLHDRKRGNKSHEPLPWSVRYKVAIGIGEAIRPPGEENLVKWAKPLLQKGAVAVPDLLDPNLECHMGNAQQILRMIQAAEACVNSEEFRRPGIDKVVAILRGIEEEEEGNGFISRKSSSFSVNGCVLDCYTQSQSQRKSELNSHLALAMLGVPEFEDYYDRLFCR